MTTERLSMRRIRDLLRLRHAQGLSERAIALSLGLGKTTVGGFLTRARQADLSRPLAPELDDDSLELLLFPSPTMAYRVDTPILDCAAMDVELRRLDVTRALLWQEYRARSPDGFGLLGFESISTPGKAGFGRRCARRMWVGRRCSSILRVTRSM